MTSRSPSPPVSVVVCTCNRAHLLRRTLRALACQIADPTGFEVVVVDDGSFDGTKAACDAMETDRLDLRYVPTGRNIGLAAAANLGVRSARGDLMLFTDDDCIPHEDWIAHMQAALGRHPVVAGSIATPVSNYVKLCHNIAQFHPFLTGRTAGPTTFIAGANMGFRATVLQELGGFDERGRTPDMELVLRAGEMGYGAYFAPNACVTHDPERTRLGGIFRYSSEHGADTIWLRKRHRALLRTPFLLRSPAFLLLSAPLIALKATLTAYLGNPWLARRIATAPLVFCLKLAWCWGAARGLRNGGIERDGRPDEN